MPQHCEVCRANPNNMPHRSSGDCNRHKKEMELKETQNSIQQLQTELATIQKTSGKK